MAERRPERVAHLVQAELARLFLRGTNDPRLQDVTVSAVRMTPDLRVARVYVHTLGGPETLPATMKALARAAHFLRGEVGRALGLRVTPELRFEYDESVERGDHISRLIDSVIPRKKKK